MLTVGTDGASCRAALGAAEAFPQVYAAIGRHPNYATASTTPIWRSCARSPPTRAAWRSARPGSTSTATTLPAPTRSARSPRRSSSRASSGKPLVIHTRAAERRHARSARRAGAGGERGDALLLDAPRIWRSAWSAATRSPSPATSPTKAPPISPRPRGGCPTSACWSRPTPPTSRPRPVRKHPNQPAFVAHTAAFLAELRGVSSGRSWGRSCERNRRARVRMVSARWRPSRRCAGCAVRRAPRPRARPELPDRLQHPRGDRPRRASSRRRTWCSRSAAARECSPSYLAPRVPRTCTWSRWTSGCATALDSAVAELRQCELRLGRCDASWIWPGCDPRPEQGGGQSALRDRRGRGAAHDRGAARRVSCGW